MGMNSEIFSEKDRFQTVLKILRVSRVGVCHASVVIQLHDPDSTIA